MIKETDSIYAYKVEHAKNFSFNTMMSLARDFVRGLDQEQSDELFDELNHGVEILSTEPQMNMYLYSYGRMHEAKLKLAFENMGEDYKQMDDFAIVDYGCGQGLASIVLYDYLKTLGLEKNVHKVVLIEPSEAALKRAALHASMAYPNTEIVTVNKYIDDVTVSDIACDNEMTFNLLSNILDIHDISLEHLAEIINQVDNTNKKIVCVGPNFRNATRYFRMRHFCDKLDAELDFELEKEKGEWNRDWTCQIMVCSHQCYELSSTLSTEVTDEDLADAWEDEFGVKYSRDGKRLLKANLDKSVYGVKEGTIVICDYAFAEIIAFGESEPLQHITIPMSVISIGRHAFSCCESMQSIIIPDSVRNIGGAAFHGCKSLQHITIPKLATRIENSVFWGCKSLQHITIPDSIASIGNCVFWGCKSLRRITIPDSVTTIGTSVFRGCNLNKVIIKSRYYTCDGICLIHKKTQRLISCYKSDVKSYIIPESVTSIGESAFSDCESLQRITIPDSVKSIGNYAFSGCKSLINIKIPDSVTNIENSVFSGCLSLQYLTIPKSVVTIQQ